MFETIQAILAKNLRIDKEKIKPESLIIDDLGADSLDLVEVLMALEEAFGVEIPDDAASSLKTVNDLMDYIKAHKDA